MWRRGHGRVAAMALVGGALLGCGTSSPKPAARVIAEEEERDHDERFFCGGAGRERAETPIERRAALTRAIEGRSTGCAVDEAGRHGEAHVTIGRAENDFAVDVTVDPGLTEADRRCILNQARAVTQMGDALVEDVATPLEVTVSLGAWPPLFEPDRKLTKDWLAAMRGQAARTRFAAALPAEVTLRDNDCLSIPVRRSFSERLDRWLATIETPLDAFWQPGRGIWRPEQRPDWPGLLDGIGPSGGLSLRAYWLHGQAVLLHRRAGDRDRQEICLVALDETVRQKIRFAVDDRGTCWVGSLDDILLHPRVEFPTDRRFKAVAVERTHACALDDAGAPVCCGERFDADPPAGPLSAIAVGTEFACGIEPGGALRCWGLRPLSGAGVEGPFDQIAIAWRDVCAIRRGTGELACWRGDGVPIEKARDRWQEFKSAPLMQDGPSCRVTLAGRVECEPSVPFTREPRAPQL
jgi:hypothetical protein